MMFELQHAKVPPCRPLHQLDNVHVENHERGWYTSRPISSLKMARIYTNMYMHDAHTRWITFLHTNQILPKNIDIILLKHASLGDVI